MQVLISIPLIDQSMSSPAENTLSVTEIYMEEKIIEQLHSEWQGFFFVFSFPLVVHTIC